MMPRIVAALACLLLAACATSGPMPPQIRKLAVASNREPAITGAMQALATKGYATVDIGLHQRISSVNAPDLLWLCREQGADALLFIDVYNVSSNTITNNYGSTTYYNAAASVSLVDTLNSRTLWTSDNAPRTPLLVSLLLLPVAIVALPPANNGSETSAVVEAGRTLGARVPARGY